MLGTIGTLWAAQRSDLAVQLLGTADDLREKMGIGVYRPDRLAHEAPLTNLQRQLAPISFFVAWKAGQLRILDDAITVSVNFWQAVTLNLYGKVGAWANALRRQA